MQPLKNEFLKDDVNVYGTNKRASVIVLLIRALIYRKAVKLQINFTDDVNVYGVSKA